MANYQYDSLCGANRLSAAHDAQRPPAVTNRIRLLSLLEEKRSLGTHHEALLKKVCVKNGCKPDPSAGIVDKGNIQATSSGIRATMTLFCRS